MQPHSHAGNECPARFARIFGAPLPGWTKEGKKDAAAWSGDGAAMLQPTREALTKYLKEHGLSAHSFWPVSESIAEIAARSLRSGGCLREGSQRLYAHPGPVGHASLRGV